MGNFENIDLYTIVFFTFIETTIYLLVFFKTNMVLNYSGLVSLKVI